MNDSMYADKDVTYFSNIRKELLDLIPIHNRQGNLLEIGAGSGNTLIHAKKYGYADKIWGVELCEIPMSLQTNPDFEQFIIANIETDDLPFEAEQFDVILCGDVLEHLINPDEVLKQLKQYLKNDGILIASIPNIREWHVIKSILFKGDFQYTDAGILDKTHLRFFCKKNIIELFKNNGFHIQKIISNNNLIGYRSKLFNVLTFNLLEQFIAAQYYVVTNKQC